MGLLLWRRSFSRRPYARKPEFQNTAGGMTNRTSAIGIEEQVQVDIEKAGE